MKTGDIVRRVSLDKNPMGPYLRVIETSRWTATVKPIRLRSHKVTIDKHRLIVIPVIPIKVSQSALINMINAAENGCLNKVKLSFTHQVYDLFSPYGTLLIQNDLLIVKFFTVKNSHKILCTVSGTRKFVKISKNAFLPYIKELYGEITFKQVLEII